MSLEQENEYREVSAFVDYFATHILKIDPANPAHPKNVEQRHARQFSKSKMLAGVRQAANDLVESTLRWHSDQVKALDEALRAQAIVTLTEMRQRYSRLYKAVLKRGVIRNEGEYYLVNGVLIDLGDRIAADEAKLLQKLVSDFEGSRK